MSRLLYRTSQVMAWLGGVVLTAMALLSVTSIAGRALSGVGLGPVPGDFELVEVGTALAVFCFLPWTHLKRGHASVDLFWKLYPPGLQRVLEVAADVLMLVVWVLLIWRMAIVTEDYRGNAEVSFILQMPVWWGYAASLVPGAIGCVVYAWRVLEDLGLASPPPGFQTAGGEH
jgi:TRAP-type C4-dicarboxylate transport system permease small subunit